MSKNNIKKQIDAIDFVAKNALFAERIIGQKMYLQMVVVLEGRKKYVPVFFSKKGNVYKLAESDGTP